MQADRLTIQMINITIILTMIFSFSWGFRGRASAGVRSTGRGFNSMRVLPDATPGYLPYGVGGGWSGA